MNQTRTFHSVSNMKVAGDFQTWNLPSMHISSSIESPFLLHIELSFHFFSSPLCPRSSFCFTPSFRVDRIRERSLLSVVTRLPIHHRFTNKAKAPTRHWRRSQALKNEKLPKQQNIFFHNGCEKLQQSPAKHTRWRHHVKNETLWL